jgi:hypothetical protein
MIRFSRTKMFEEYSELLLRDLTVGRPAQQWTSPSSESDLIISYASFTDGNQAIAQGRTQMFPSVLESF